MPRVFVTSVCDKSSVTVSFLKLLELILCRVKQIKSAFYSIPKVVLNRFGV